MAENENSKDQGLFGAFQGLFDSVKAGVQGIKLPEVKMPEIKMPEVTIPGLFQHGKEKNGSDAAPEEITSVSIPSVIRIIYYMMHADGELRPEEEQKFDEICSELDPGFAEKKESLVSVCQAQMNKVIDPEDDYAVLQDGVEEAVAAGKNAKESALAPKVLVWDLLTLAYSDHDYDENERKLLKYIVRKLNLDKAVFLEMESSFLALRDLENELAWIKTTNRPYLTIENMVNEIADRKTAIFESVKDLIAF